MSGSAPNPSPTPDPAPAPVIDRHVRVDATIPAPWLIGALIYVFSMSFATGGAWMSTQTRLTQIESVQAENRALRDNEEHQIQDLTHTLAILQEDSANQSAAIKDMASKIDKNTDLLQNFLHINDFPGHKTGLR